MVHLPHVQTDPWEFALGAVRSNTRAVLVYVVEHSGSVPGVTGTNVVVTESAFAGTIGGGAAEKELVERARAHEGPVEIVRFRHTPSEGGTLCSGLQIFALVSLTSAHEETLAKIVRALTRHRTGTLRLGPDTLLFEDGPAAPHHFFEDGADWGYQGPIGLLDTLTIVGGGHVALAFSRLMISLPYRVVVLDNRAELATLEANTFAHERRVVDYADVAEHVPDGPRSWVVIMTYGHAHDRFVLERLLGRDYAYLGVLGSKAKIRAMFAEMTADGTSPELIETVRAPVGLAIGSHTPEEIAVSIAGEMIALRNGLEPPCPPSPSS
ncbi:MAG: XdhC family protein [Holophagae bacterium]|jgi:xanthine dehydrogenase accessory factor